jgi:hypothetical protein
LTGLDERLIELIQADVDGELDRHSAADRADLARALLGDADARGLREELMRLRAALSRVPEVAPPAGLRSDILASVEARPPATVAAGSGAALRYAAVFAGGALVTTLAFVLFRGTGANFDAARIVGTLAPADRGIVAGSSRDLNFERAGVAAGVTLHDLDPLIIIDLELDSLSPVEVVAGFDPGMLRFAGFSALEDEAPSVNVTASRVTLVSSGAHRYAVVLRRTDGRATRVHLEFTRDGTAVGAADLDVPGTG